MDRFLLRGDEKLAKYKESQHRDFKLVGRDSVLNRLSAILMRSQANSVILFGPGGVGCSALCLGLHGSKSDPNVPYDVMVKRFLWLDTDGLFSSGNSEKINTSFDQMMDMIYRTPDSVLIINDTRDFIEAARNAGLMHFINALTAAVKQGRTQMILETRDDDLEAVLKTHSDFRQYFTLMDLEEPDPDSLLKIVQSNAESLVKFHGIQINEDATRAAIELTNKYRTQDMGLNRAQPERSITVLDRSLSTYRLEAHKKPTSITALEAEYTKTPNEELAVKIDTIKKEWHRKQNRLKHLFKDLRNAEFPRIALEQELQAQLKKEEDARLDGTKNGNTLSKFGNLVKGYESKEVADIRERIKKLADVVEENKNQFEALTVEINQGLELTRDMVLKEFSQISRIPVQKLSEDEREKLIKLPIVLKSRVFGQDHALDQIVNGVRVHRLGRRTGRPLPYLLRGPSGVGKTELFKALAFALYDDENALVRFDMSEYMEKHAVARLIGAPPGYELAEVGGQLTNTMRKNPARLLLFDEIEKAHEDIFNIFLQILGDGRLTDNVGRTVQFGDSVVGFTSNIGQQFYLDRALSFEEADDKATEELNQHFRSEFLNRINGRENIIGFQRLNLDSIQKIVRRELRLIDENYRDRNIRTEMSDADLEVFCRDHYDPKVGARGLPGYINTNIEAFIVNATLTDPHARGTLRLGYDAAQKRFEPKLIPA